VDRKKGKRQHYRRNRGAAPVSVIAPNRSWLSARGGRLCPETPIAPGGGRSQAGRRRFLRRSPGRRSDGVDSFGYCLMQCHPYPFFRPHGDGDLGQCVPSLSMMRAQRDNRDDHGARRTREIRFKYNESIKRQLVRSVALHGLKRLSDRTGDSRITGDVVQPT
jgi:hypothetical protein